MIALRVGAAAVATVIIVVLVAPMLAPLVTGHRLVVVDGGSMAPSFDAGDVLVTAAPSGHDLHVGAVLVIGTHESLYTHRVVEVDRAGDETRARLRGDANPVPDPGWVRQGDVYAVVVTALTGPVGHIVRVVTTVPGTIVLLAAAIALLLTGARDATRRPRPRSRHSPTRPDRTAEPAP
ncbi:MAG TPA: signal peptidase I [Protaetiibacter sp.]|nr:signal peptidase I [Protaetiibacter sp.]